MSNKYRGIVEVEIEGKVRKLKYNMNALVMLQEKLGLSGMDAIMKVLENMDFKVMRTVLWVGLIHEDKELTEEQVGDWDFDIKEVITKMGDALKKAFGNVDEKKVKNLAKAKAIQTSSKK